MDFALPNCFRSRSEFDREVFDREVIVKFDREVIDQSLIVKLMRFRFC